MKPLDGHGTPETTFLADGRRADAYPDGVLVWELRDLKRPEEQAHDGTLILSPEDLDLTLGRLMLKSILVAFRRDIDAHAPELLQDFERGRRRIMYALMQLVD